MQDIPSDHVADGCADENVGRMVVQSPDARHADGRRKAVDPSHRKLVVLVPAGDDGGECNEVAAWPEGNERPPSQNPLLYAGGSSFFEKNRNKTPTSN